MNSSLKCIEVQYSTAQFSFVLLSTEQSSAVDLHHVEGNCRVELGGFVMVTEAGREGIVLIRGPPAIGVNLSGQYCTYSHRCLLTLGVSLHPLSQKTGLPA